MANSASGENVAGYDAARSGGGLVELERGLLEVRGPVRQKYLEGMLTNEVAALRPGEGRPAALLTARGGITALVRVLVDGDVVLIEAHGQRLERLQRQLEHHRVAAPVRFAARAAAVLALVGPQAGRLLEAAGATLPPATSEAHVVTTLAGHELRVVSAGDLPGSGFVLHVAPEAAAGVREALLAAGAAPLGPAALDALRVEALRPWDGLDVAEDNLLHETGLLEERVSRTKGCYVGQEIVARLDARGANVSRALRGLRLASPVERGAAVTREGREVGQVTTAAESPRLGPIAMGYVHRSSFTPGTELLVGGVAATVVAAFEERT